VAPFRSFIEERVSNGYTGINTLKLFVFY